MKKMEDTSEKVVEKKEEKKVQKDMGKVQKPKNTSGNRSLFEFMKKK